MLFLFLLFSVALAIFNGTRVFNFTIIGCTSFFFVGFDRGEARFFFFGDGAYSDEVVEDDAEDDEDDEDDDVDELSTGSVDDELAEFWECSEKEGERGGAGILSVL